jgi:hypothetical protein
VSVLCIVSITVDDVIGEVIAVGWLELVEEIECGFCAGSVVCAVDDVYVFS